MTKSDALLTARLFETDVYRWACEQAAHIRAGRLDKIDLMNAAEEIDDVGKREYDKLVGHLRVVLTHMLKRDFHPVKRSRSWRKSICASRGQIDYRLDGSPSLEAKREEWLPKAYKLARDRAALETDLAIATFPATCPYDWEAIMTRPFVLDRDDP